MFILPFLLLLNGAFAFERIMGPMVALFTPMHANGTVNPAAVPEYAKLMESKGISNVMVAGTTGESVSLSSAERKMMAKAWMDVAKAHKLKVYVHVGTDSVMEAKDLARHAQEIGTAGVLSMTPNYFTPSNAEALVSTMMEISAGAPELPFWYYHFPDMTGVKIKMIDFLHEAERRNFKNLMGVKFTDEQLMDFYLCAEFMDKKYNMIYGRDEQLLSALVINANGAVGSTFNFLDWNLALMKAFEDGDMDMAQEMQLKTALVCNIFSDYPGVDVQKEIFAMQHKVDIGPCRLPQTQLTAAQKTELMKQLKELDVPGF